MKYKNFEDFLGSKHADGYMGTDDDMPDAFSNWLGDLDVYEFLELGDEYALYLSICPECKRLPDSELLCSNCHDTK